MKKLLLFVLSLALFAGAAFAQAKKKAAKEPAKPAAAPVTVIVAAGEASGGVDQALNANLERFLGVPLEITAVDREAALKDAKYAGLNLDYMPLYLLGKTKLTEEKFGEHVKQGYLKDNKDFIIFEKATRLGTHMNNPRKPGVLELFVMSQCPYGAMAEGRVIEALNKGRIPEHIKVDVRYIVSEGGGEGKNAFRSLHGTGEWEENIRQLIIKDKYPNKFWKYLEIRNEDYQSSLWDVAAKKAGINPKVFGKEWKRGVELLKQEAKYGEKIGVSASPTFLWEGRVVTDINGLAGIPGLEGIANASPKNAPSAPAGGQC
ncbi:MAG: hypothetical protein LBG16_05445 [Elusimicrobiota bacterium]|jgi:hypothetical protein|nr:hypothetical protein [Elusimicrobiota bacterium]